MAQYWEDWSGSTLDAEPTGWTKRYNHSSTTYAVQADAEGPAGRRLRITKGTSQRSLLSLNAVDADSLRAKCKIRALVRIVTDSSSSASVSFAGVGARGAGSTSSETVVSGALGKGSGFAIDTYAECRSLSYASGTLTSVSSSAPAYTSGGYYWLGLDLDGASVTVTTAARATPETIIETASTTTSVSAAGWTGLFSFSGSTVTSFDVFAVAIATGESPAFYSDPGVADDPVSFSGTVPAQSWVEDSAITPLDLSTYFAGDLTPFAYAVTTGTLPAGLSLNSSTGVISGTPTTPASAVSIAVTATDDESNTAATNAFNVTITDFVEAVRGVQVVLHDRATQSPRASVTGITARWWDSPTAAGAPLLKTDTASTDAAGLLELDIESVTSLALAGVGYLSLYKAGASPETDLHFASRIAVADIA